MPPRIIKNDYTAPRPLAASLLPKRAPAGASGSGSAAGQVVTGPVGSDPNEYVERAEKEWNERVDTEMEGLAGGLAGLVEVFGSPSTLLTPLSTPLLSSSLLRNSTNLLKLTHELKLLLLLSIPDASAAERDQLEREIEALKVEVGGLLRLNNKRDDRGEEEGEKVVVAVDGRKEGEGEVGADG